MSTEPQPTTEVQPETAQVVPNNLLAPVWHTAVLVALLLGNSFFSASLMSRAIAHGPRAISQNGQALGYAFSIVLEFVLLGFVWIGLRIRGTRMRDLIGGRWRSPENFLLDVAIALGFWIVSYAVLAGLSFALGMVKPSQIEETKKLAGIIGPKSWIALVSFLGLSTAAGFVEEIIFRGYLQRQFASITRNPYAGLAVSALCFGLAHGYEGVRRMVLITVFGSFFGFLALWRKSLRPGMMAHAWFDSFQGILLYIATRFGLFSAR